MSIREAAQKAVDDLQRIVDSTRPPTLHITKQILVQGFIEPLRTVLAEKQPELRVSAGRVADYCYDEDRSFEDAESFILAALQSAVDAAKEEQREADAKTVAEIRKSMSDALGGMGPGSSVWGNRQWDKGYCAGIIAALTAFDIRSQAIRGLAARLRSAGETPDASDGHDLSRYAFATYGHDARLYNGIHDFESRLQAKADIGITAEELAEIIEQQQSLEGFSGGGIGFEDCERLDFYRNKWPRLIAIIQRILEVKP